MNWDCSEFQVAQPNFGTAVSVSREQKDQHTLSAPSMKSLFRLSLATLTVCCQLSDCTDKGRTVLYASLCPFTFYCSEKAVRMTIVHSRLSTLDPATITTITSFARVNICLSIIAMLPSLL